LPETLTGETQFVLLSYYIFDLHLPSRTSNIINNCLASLKLVIGAIYTTQATCQANYRCPIFVYINVVFPYVMCQPAK